jgi:hypothetical protein
MKTTKGFVCLIAVAVLTLTMLASAAPKAKKIGITLFNNVVVSGITLKPGDYQVVVEENSATFLREGREVVKVTVESQDAGTKFPANELVTSDANALKEICLGGTSTKLVLK